MHTLGQSEYLAIAKKALETGSDRFGRFRDEFETGSRQVRDGLKLKKTILPASLVVVVVVVAQPCI